MMKPARKARLFNALMAVIFLALTLALPVRGMLWPNNAAADVQSNGTVVFDAENVNSASNTAQYIMLFLFGSLTLIFAARAIQSKRSQDSAA